MSIFFNISNDDSVMYTSGIFYLLLIY